MSFLIDNLRTEGLATLFRFEDSPPVEYVWLDVNPDGSGHYIDVPTFLGFFGPVLADPAISDNYPALMAASAAMCAPGVDNEQAGYGKYFKAWRDAGISFVGVDTPDIKETSGFKGFISRFFGG